MWNYIQTLIISVFIIFIIHSLWNYIKDTYSTKKTKDLVGYQTQKYKSILEEVIQNKKTDSENISNAFINEEQSYQLSNDLNQFMEQQLQQS
jgi:hypothetical protein